MKINSIVHSNMVKTYNDNTRKISKSSETGQKDSLEISKEARDLSNLKNDTVTENSVAKLELIKNQIANGTYRPNHKLIAQKMIAIIQGSEI